MQKTGGTSIKIFHFERGSKNSHYNLTDVVTRNMKLLTETVSMDLTYFSSKFVEKSFIVQSATNDVLTRLGITDRDKGSQLLHLVTENYKLSLNKQLWTKKFITLFSSEVAYTDLATRLSSDIPDILSTMH